MLVRAATQVPGLTERQVGRPLKAYRLRGADGLGSEQRRRPGGHDGIVARKTPTFDAALQA
jgi:hypothetical protein